MFNSTHTLVGVAVARTGLDRWMPGAIWTAVIASNLPDIDILTELGSTASYLDHHRGITHSIIGVPILSLILAAVMSRISGGSFRKHFVIALIAMATHPLLDFMNNYGVRPFLPFSGTWYYGDILFVVDPYLDLLLGLGLLISFRTPKRRTMGAVIALSLALIYVGGRLELRDMAQKQLARYSATVSGFVRSAVSPQMLNPLTWTGFVETQNDVASVSIDLMDGAIHEVARISKTPPSAVTAAADATYTGKVFRSFARFPVTRIETTPSGYRVLLIDFRFFRETANTALAAEILLDRSLQVENESLSFTSSVE
jgi:inner membrane protein